MPPFFSPSHKNSANICRKSAKNASISAENQKSSSTHTVIDNNTLAELLYLAFKQLLAELTYYPNACADWLTEYWHLIPPGMKRHIHQAISCKRVFDRRVNGKEPYTEHWKRILALPLDEEA